MTWEVGDLAVCVNDAKVTCDCGKTHNNSEARVSKGMTSEVVRIARASELSLMCASAPCNCPALVLANGFFALALRFRKIHPDEHEACEEEFVTLLQRIKRLTPEKLSDPMMKRKAA